MIVCLSGLSLSRGKTVAMPTEQAIIKYFSNTGEVVPVLTHTSGAALDRNPAAVYLATLRPTGRRSMHHYLNIVAGLLSSGQQNALTFNWAEVRYQHAAALAARVQEDYKPATANNYFSSFAPGAQRNLAIRAD